MNTFTIDWREPGKPFNRFWEACVGSCHAYTALREDWRQQTRRCRDGLGFRYVRFHGLFYETTARAIKAVVAPVAVRYAWADNPVCNLYNGASLPAAPFRTDNWTE